MKFEKSFPLRYRTKQFQWRVADSNLDIELLQPLEKLLDNPENIPKKYFFKNEKRRLIFLWEKTWKRTSHALLIKSFSLERLKERLHYRKYVIAEAINLIKAKKQDLPVPEVYAVGSHRSFFGINFSVVIMAYLPYPSMRDLFLCPSEEANREQLLKRTGRLISMLYSKGVNHIYFGPHAIPLSQEVLGIDSIIDWQYASFTKPQVPELLASLAGYFGWSVATNRDWLSISVVSSWFLELLEELEIEKTTAIWDLFQKNLTARASSKDRLNRTSQSF